MQFDSFRLAQWESSAVPPCNTSLQANVTINEISYDLAMDDEMEFVEGTYRLAGRDWQVFIFSRREVKQPTITDSSWASGVTGVHAIVPRNMRLNQTAVETLLGRYFSVEAWSVVCGPDSMLLR